MSQDMLFARILDEDSRPNPYPLYAIMRKTPIARQADGTYVVSSYDAIYRLLYDPRLSSEDLPPPSVYWTGNPIKDLIVDPLKAQVRAPVGSLIMMPYCSLSFHSFQCSLNIGDQRLLFGPQCSGSFE